MFGVSTNNLRKNLKWARKGIFSFSYAPLEFLMYGGVIFMVLAFLGLCVTIALRFLDPSVPRGFTAVITLVLGFGGLQLFATSIVGEYVGKVLDETKKRPKYIVRSILAGGDEKTSVNQVKEFLDLRARGRDIGY
jgi:dolichol-phosphate mannosyltransferase